MTESQFDPPNPPYKTLNSQSLPRMTLKTSENFFNFESRRDAYGFTLRPQHLQRYREYASIYKKEEEERFEKWKTFFEQHPDSAQPRSSPEENSKTLHAEVTEQKIEPFLDVIEEGDGGGKSIPDVPTEGDPKKEGLVATQKNIRRVQTWVQARPSLRVIESIMSFLVKDINMKDEQISTIQYQLTSIEEMRPSNQEPEKDVEVVLCDTNIVNDGKSASGIESEVISPEPFLTWKKELEFLVHGGVPRDLRGEVWQAFVGVRTRRVERYYQDLLDPDSEAGYWQEQNKYLSDNGTKGLNGDAVGVHEKWRKQIEKVAWISGPWFLSIFVNMIPWESVLRVWDVLLFEGNRVMLFRTALALMELYGPALVTTNDAGDAITLLQSLVGSTFDSSQLVLTACMGYLTVTEDRLQQLREKHRPAVLEAVEERSKGGRVCKNSKGLASKLYSFKHDAESLVKEANAEEGSDYKLTDRHKLPLDSQSTNLDEFVSGLSIDSELDALPDIQEQVVWLKVELCRLLEEKRSATLRAEELETAFMEIVKEDNRRELTARVEQLQQEVTELRQLLEDKKQQENVMLQVLMRVEQEQKATEDARIFAEKDAAAQRYAVLVIQEKYEKAMASVAQMEKRVIMAESMLEATLQYESGQIKAQSSPRPVRPDSSEELQTRRTSLLSFGLNWRDRNKAKPTNVAVSTESISAGEMGNTNTKQVEINGNQGLER